MDKDYDDVRDRSRQPRIVSVSVLTGLDGICTTAGSVQMEVKSKENFDLCIRRGNLYKGISILEERGFRPNDVHMTSFGSSVGWRPIHTTEVWSHLHVP